MAMALHEPLSVVVPLRLCSTPESMDEKSSESDTSRSNSPKSRDEVSFGHYHVPVNSHDDSTLQARPDVFPATPPLHSSDHTTIATPPNPSTASSHKNHPTQNLHNPTTPLPSSLIATALPQASSSSPSSALTPHHSSTASSVTGSNLATTQQQISVSTKHLKCSTTSPSQSGEPSPITSATAVSSVSSAHSFQPPMLLSQYDAAAAAAAAKQGSENMLTLSSYVQFLTLQQQGQMSYPTLLPSACLPQSVANPPTTLPPQYDNFTTTYAPSFSNGLPSLCGGNKFNGMIPPHLNQGVIALDMPSAAAAQTKHSLHSGLNMDHGFMVGGQLQGALPGHEVARAVGSVGVPLVISGQSDRRMGATMAGARGDSASGRDNGYKRVRKRSYSQTNHPTVSDCSDLHSYQSSARRSVFPSEDQQGGGGGGDSHCTSHSSSAVAAGSSGSPPQQLKWQAHQVDTWHDLCDGALQDIPQISFIVETDKGFNFSVVDDAFVCQKKNHFQVTVQTAFHKIPKFIKMKDGSIQPVDKFTIQLYGVKLDSIGTTIKLEQSMTDRRRSVFEPIEVQVPSNPEETARHTICRLHFCETTANNMRKRGKPNPDQKYFSLVVELLATCELGTFPVVAHVSERIVVRASNPGNFDNDCDYLWLKGNAPDSIYHHGRVGINTDKAEEALSVNGNIRVTGRIMHPSDLRIKTNIQPVDSSRQLDRVSRLQLYQYRYKDGVMSEKTAADCTRQVGVLAQELRQVIPDAVHETNTNISLADGSTVPNLLIIDKDRVLMETIGAVQQLKKITDDLSQRLAAMERGQHSVKCSSLLQRPHSPMEDRWSPMRLLAVMVFIFLLFAGLLILLTPHVYSIGSTISNMHMTSTTDRLFRHHPH